MCNPCCNQSWKTRTCLKIWQQWVFEFLDLLRMDRASLLSFCFLCPDPLLINGRRILGYTKFIFQFFTSKVSYICPPMTSTILLIVPLMELPTYSFKFNNRPDKTKNETIIRIPNQFKIVKHLVLLYYPIENTCSKLIFLRYF